MSLKHAILGFLSYFPLSGYDLKKGFDQSVRHFWPANQSQIYRTLAELDAEGLVQKEIVQRQERLDMKVYSITESGAAELHRWLATPLPPQDTREPFLIQIFFGGRISDAEMLNLLEHQLVETQQLLEQYDALFRMTLAQPNAQTDTRDFFLRMATLGYGIAGAHAYIKWLTNLVEHIQAGNYSVREIADVTGEAREQN